MTHSAEGADPLSERIQALLDSHTFEDETAFSRPLQEDLHFKILALIREERRAELEWLKDQQSFFAGAGEVVTVADIEARINQLNNEVNPNE
jgi:hypothetical protein